jgi:hypothetical protein
MTCSTNLKLESEVGIRGPKSAAGLAIIGPGGIETIRRPNPPPSLTDEQAVEWRRVINGMPADYFPAETQALLELRCRHVVYARRLADMIEAEQKSDEYDWKTHRELLKSMAEQSHAIAMLDTKMRLAQQTTYERSQPKRKSHPSTPWPTKEG